MKIDLGMADDAVLAELGRRVERLRLERNITQEQLAREAGIARGTLVRLESGEPVRTTALLRILRALALLDHVELLVPEPLPSPIARLRLEGRQRQRASSSRSDDGQTAPWTWGDEPPTAEQ
jgi:transcriptional regulator with XRE-family HTH domain